MARTKASVGAKISTGKSSKARCSAAPPASSGGGTGASDKSGRSYGGGNPVCPRETPKWQRPITNFFNCPRSGSKEESEESASSKNTSEEPEKRKSKRNIIESDEEPEEPPKNQVLDESINLEPLNGDDSHKLEEFYPKNGVNKPKGKGVGKKTMNKENMDCNKRESVKRDSEFEDEDSRPNKKSKMNVC